MSNVPAQDTNREGVAVLQKIGKVGSRSPDARDVIKSDNAIPRQKYGSDEGSENGSDQGFSPGKKLGDAPEEGSARSTIMAAFGKMYRSARTTGQPKPLLPIGGSHVQALNQLEQEQYGRIGTGNQMTSTSQDLTRFGATNPIIEQDPGFKDVAKRRTDIALPIGGNGSFSTNPRQSHGANNKSRNGKQRKGCGLFLCFC